MRSDMSKVVTERPRYGSNSRNKRVDQGRQMRVVYDEDGAIENDRHSRTEPLCPKGYYQKDFSDHIRPLIRFLRAQVGRNWDSVYSEISANLPKGTLGLHIRQHVEWEVGRNVEMVNGTPYNKIRVAHRVSKVTGLYVHPVTNILCWEKRVPRRKNKVSSLPVEIIPRIPKKEFYISKENPSGISWFLVIISDVGYVLLQDSLISRGFHRGLFDMGFPHKVGLFGNELRVTFRILPVKDPRK